MSEKEKESFFKREKAIGSVIPEPGNYDPTNKDDIESCGLDRDSLNKRSNEMFLNLNVDSNTENPVATVCMAFESNFSKRELAFLLGKDTLIQSVRESLTQTRREDGK